MGHSTISELPAEEQPFFAARHLFGAGAVDRGRDLVDLMRMWRPDLVVHDTLELGSPTAAILRGIPHVTHGYGPTVPGTTMFAAAIGSALADAGLPDPIADVLAAPYVDICPPGLRGVEPNPWTTVHLLRPSPGEVELPAETRLDLSGLPHPDTVYITLGTIVNQAPAVFRAVIDGCTRRTVNLVVTTGPEFDPAELEPLPPAVRVTPFLPQASVLPHCQAVISHAGAGTMLGALCYGLPQLCLPQGTDQPSNTAALLSTGAGLALQPDEITADAVADAVDRLIDEPSFRQAAQRLRDEIDSMPTAAAVLEDIFADHHANGGGR
ncbi:MAG: hypothetical protein QOF00_4127 [Pseudonocardiales bacterium]|nr:hypothetical protein [Pseudonocardiales bacterium]